jgi:hypothetical protein
VKSILRGSDGPDESSFGIGVADGLFAAVLAARAATAGSEQDPETGGRAAVVVPPGGTPAFLAPWPVTILERFELSDLLNRLGIRRLGQFAGLPSRDVLARFGKDGAACQMAASGKTGELPGLRLADFAVHREGQPPPVVRQPGFWGGTAEADVRAGAALARIQKELGPEEVLLVKLQGGRAPSERARFVPVDSRSVGSTKAQNANQVQSHKPQHEPWPGRLPAPSPAIVLARAVPVEVIDAKGSPVVVSARILLSSAPARVSVGGEPFEEISGWAGPWPADDLWWSNERRRRARMQLVSVRGTARLLASEAGSWWLEGVYD